MEHIKIYVATIIGFVGAFIANLFGGWSTDIATLCMFMAIDFAMGLILAGVFKRSSKSQNGALQSYAGWQGLCKKGVTLLVVLVAHRLDITLGIDFVRTGVIIGYIAIELISITENAGLMGVPLPAAITKAIEILKNKEVK